VQVAGASDVNGERMCVLILALLGSRYPSAFSDRLTAVVATKLTALAFDMSSKAYVDIP
jgi:hypothetical protein